MVQCIPNFKKSKDVQKAPACAQTIIPCPIQNKSCTYQHLQTLGGGWTTQLKNMLVKIGIFHKVRDENKQYLKPPPRTDW